MHYEPSALSSPQHQACAAKLAVGERVVPHAFVRAADGRPYDIQDLLPSDTRFKILLFAGNTADAAQSARVAALAERMAAPEGFLARFGRGAPEGVFDIISISSAKKDVVNFTGAYVRCEDVEATNAYSAVLCRSPCALPSTLVQVSTHP